MHFSNYYFEIYMVHPLKFFDRRYSYILLFIVIFSFSLKANKDINAVHSDYILILNPDAETCAWGHMFIPSVSQALSEKYSDLDIYIEYMYVLGMTTEKEVSEFKDKLFKKYSTPPKYLILFEADMYGFIYHDIEKYWGNDMPILLVARENHIGPEKYYIERKVIPEEERMSLVSLASTHPNLTVILNLFDIPGTLLMMKQMRPNMDKLFFITDNRYISAWLRDEIQQIVESDYPEWKFENLTPDKLTTDDLINKFLSIPQESGILYFTWYNNEITGNKDLILQTNAYRIFSLYVNTPIITINDVGLKESGMLGGSYTRFPQVMETILQTMDKIIAGHSFNQAIYPPKPVPTFNYLAMLEHDISLSSIPDNTYLYNRPLTFLERNKTLIISLLILLFLGIIAMRIILLVHKRRMQYKEIKLLEKYGNLFNNMPIGYQQQQLVFNEDNEAVDFIVIEVNPCFEKQIMPGEICIRRRGTEVAPEVVSEIMDIYKLLTKDRDKKLSMSYFNKDTGCYYTIILSLSSAPDCLDLFFVDVTQLYKIQRELVEAKEKAEESNRLKSAFLANMSHEIRTPLNAIVGFSSILSSTDDETEKEKYIRIIEDNNDLLLQLINDILDLSKIEAGVMNFSYANVDLNTLMNGIKESTQNRTQEGVKIIFENYIADCYVYTEQTRLSQIVSNLLNNATKFTSNGDIRFGYKLNEEDELYFYVSDTGIGISSDQLENIFGRFVKLNSFVQGTGLGLSLCQTIVQNMGGKIGVESEEGKGTTFWFTIPYEPVKVNV